MLITSALILSLLTAGPVVTAAPMPRPAGALACRQPTAPAANMASALSSISRRFSVAILVEGSPAIVPWSSPMPDGDTAMAVLSKLGEKAGYRVDESGGVFLLRRLYLNAQPEEMPAVSVDELRASLRDIRRIVDAFPAPQRDLPTELRAFLSESSGPMLERMQAGPIPIGQLPPQWQTTLLLHFYGRQVFALQKQINDNGGLIDKWSGATVAAVEPAGAGTNVTLRHNATRISAILLPTTYKKTLANPFSGGMTIESAVKLLPPDNSPAIMVDETVRQKPIWITGEGFTSRAAGARAIGLLCGLDVRDRDNQITIRRRRVDTPANITGVPAALFAAIPGSVMRYLAPPELLPPVESAPPPDFQSFLASVRKERERPTINNDPVSRFGTLSRTSMYTSLHLLLEMQNKGLPQSIDQLPDGDQLRLFLDLCPASASVSSFSKWPMQFDFKFEELFIGVKYGSENGQKTADVQLWGVRDNQKVPLTGATLYNVP